MAIINLRDYYPFYTSDCFMEVSEEVAEMFKEFDRKEAAYRLRTYRHKAYYSLDRDDGLEHEAVFVALSPHAGASCGDCQSAEQTGKTDLCSFHSRHDQTGHCSGRGRP